MKSIDDEDIVELSERYTDGAVILRFDPTFHQNRICLFEILARLDLAK